MAVYACSDLHGRKDLYFKIKEILQPEDIVYFLGDANDRGPDGWELIQLIYNDKQFVYIKGNHEDMFVDAALDVLDNDGEDSRSLRLLDRNGGMVTLNAWSLDGRPTELLQELFRLPICKTYTNKDGKRIVLSHAGCTPWYNEEDKDGYEFSIWDDLLWNRDHFFDDWDEEHFSNLIIVHGHTPVPHLMDYLNDKQDVVEPGPYWYCNNHKVCLDQLSAFTDMTCILNLDTFEHKIIKVGDAE